MNVYSLLSGILVFGFFFEGLSLNSAVALFAGLGVAEALSLGHRLVAGRGASDLRLIQGRSTNHEDLAFLSR
jgi:hypothetical protein